MPWHDLQTDLYEGKLPQEMEDLYKSSVSDPEGSSFALCKRMQVAEQLLRYCNRDREKCELIGVNSSWLTSTKGILSIPDGNTTSLGWEPFQIGGGSLLLDGVFASPALFPEWVELLNGHGLLGFKEHASKYVSEFKRLAASGSVEEPFPVEQCPIEPVEIFAIEAGS
jgi:hypothetical protein